MAFVPAHATLLVDVGEPLKTAQAIHARSPGLATSCRGATRGGFVLRISQVGARGIK
jgi:hypothetical protein